MGYYYHRPSIRIAVDSCSSLRYVLSFFDEKKGALNLYSDAGESEYWFAMIKVVMIVFFIIVGLIFDWGGVKGHPGPVSYSDEKNSID